MNDFPIIATLLTVIVGFIHVYILILEMYLWDKPTGLRAFNQTLEVARVSKVLAKNQGLYNGFLAGGLFWGAYLGAAGNSIKFYFLACVIVAGVYGGLTATRKILWSQALPAVIALVALLLNI